MDPTAQTNNPNPQGDSAKSPIEPGQFVVAGDNSNSQIDPAVPVQPQPMQPSSPPQQTSPRPGFSLAQDKNLAQSYPPPPSQPPAQEPPNQPMQPDPAPFTGPGQGEFSPSGIPVSPPQGSKMKKIKLFAIILAILILIGILAAVAWFYILNKPSAGQSAKTQSGQQQEVIEPTATPQPPTGGFGQLPQATDSGEATGAGQVPNFPTPAAP